VPVLLTSQMTPLKIDQTDLIAKTIFRTYKWTSNRQVRVRADLEELFQVEMNLIIIQAMVEVKVEVMALLEELIQMLQEIKNPKLMLSRLLFLDLKLWEKLELAVSHQLIEPRIIHSRDQVLVVIITVSSRIL